MRRDILLNLSAMPYKTSADHFLGHGSSDNDPDIFNLQEDERKLDCLIIIANRMLDRCEETMRHTSRSLLCWLRSTKLHTCFPKPFTLVSHKASEKKYRRLFFQFLVFVFRAFRMPPAVRRRLTGIRFTKRQLEQLEAIWEHEAWGDANLARGVWLERIRRSERCISNFEESDGRKTCEDSSSDGTYDEHIEGYRMEDDEFVEDGEEDPEEEEDGGAGEEWEEKEDEDEAEAEKEGGENEGVAGDSPAGELLELIFQLSITFSTQQFIDAQLSFSLLVYFSEVLGFSADSQNFLAAKRYTLCLLGLIYV